MDNDNNIELSRELLESYLGVPERQCGNELEWQCPLCAENGGDTHKNNFKYNETKNVCYCFADPDHSRIILSEIYKQEWEIIKNDNISYRKKSYCYTSQNTVEINEEKFKDKRYIFYCMGVLENDTTGIYQDALSIRGLTIETALEVGLGYDDFENHWVIPTIQYSTSTNNDDYKVIGYEYRPLDFNKAGIRREKGSKSGLAMISPYTDEIEAIVIVEGYFDGYALYQYLAEQGQINKYHIVTCSNGVNSLYKQMSEIDFSKYRKFYLCIDNDEAGDKAANDILEKYPFMERIIFSCGCKDFNEHYLKCIKKQNFENQNKT